MRKDSFSLPNFNCRYNHLGLVVSYDPVLDVAASVICQSGVGGVAAWRSAYASSSLVGGFLRQVMYPSTSYGGCAVPTPTNACLRASARGSILVRDLPTCPGSAYALCDCPSGAVDISTGGNNISNQVFIQCWVIPPA